MIHYVTACFSHGNTEIKSEHTDDQCSPQSVIFSLQKSNIIIMPKYISISDKSLLFSGCPTAKLGTK